MDIKDTIVGAKVVIESLICLLENENVDISSIKFKVGSQEDEYESKSLSFESLVDLTLKELDVAKAQMTGKKFFSHDFNGDGFQYHDTLQEAKEAAEADLDIYRDRVADGKHVADMGEFNELAYGIVVGQAEWSVDCVVSADDHKNGEFEQYEVGTEILSLYLDDAQEPVND